ncbi:hypothetical protein F4782DRAFT_510848 [Xylaria castorea]|nr:hypothetical protein F4782DRAFT_510848 [Xylaria castorea]
MSWLHIPTSGYRASNTKTIRVRRLESPARGQGSPIRAIVKDYIRFKTVCGRKTLSTMRSNLGKLNDMGIFYMDVREDNYCSGRLFDFSIALTSPHVWLWPDLRSRDQIFKDCRDDLISFDRMAKNVEKQRELIILL